MDEFIVVITLRVMEKQNAMKYHKLSVLLLLGSVCFVHAGETETDLDKLQGAWQIVSLVEKGKAIPAAETDVLEITIAKEKFSVSEKGKVAVEYSIKLDPTKTPKAIDFTHEGGENKGKTEPGIYTFEKGQLKLILDEDRKGRPTVFEGKETASYSVMVLKKKGN